MWNFLQYFLHEDMKNAVQRNCVWIISVQRYISFLNTVFHNTELYLYVSHRQLTMLNISVIYIKQQALGDKAMVQQPAVDRHEQKQF
jgi:hypothetical protein